MDIKELLKHCGYANLNNYDAETMTYHIPKYAKPQFQIGKCYLVKVSKAIVKNPNSVMATNWNSGKAPQFEYLKIYISKALGTNIYVDSAGYDYENKKDLDYIWSGWLNTNDLEQLMSL